jgi:hypothetical protein
MVPGIQKDEKVIDIHLSWLRALIILFCAMQMDQSREMD